MLLGLNWLLGGSVALVGADDLSLSVRVLRLARTLKHNEHLFDESNIKKNEKYSIRPNLLGLIKKFYSSPSHNNIY